MTSPRDVYRFALAIGFFSITILAILAAPRSAAETVIPAVSGKETTSGNLDQRPFTVPPGSGIVAPAAEPLPSPATFDFAPVASFDDGGGVSSDLSRETGVIAYALPSYGRLYLALPDGRGVRVKICAVGGHPCIIRTSTDAGPSLERQRQGRRADVSWTDFAFLCDCWPPAVGIMDATIERDGAWVELPATNATP